MGKQNDDNIKGWFTTETGKHIPIREGESKADALKRALGSKGESKPQPKKTESKPKESKPATESKPKKNEVVEKNESVKQHQISKAEEEAKRLNEEQRYQDALKKGNGVTVGKDGNLYFKGEKVEDLSTSDASEGDSLSEHLDKDGKLTEERKKVHAQIIQDIIGEARPYAPGQQKKALFTGGGGAAGKGKLSARDEEKGINGVKEYYSSDDKPVVIDPDDIKKRLSKADGTKPEDYDAAHYHEESSAVAKQIYGTLVKHGYPVMYDGTSTSLGSTIKRLEQAHKSGYKTEMCFIVSDEPTVRENSIQRFIRGEKVSEDSDERIHRLVPPKTLYGAHGRASDAVEALQDRTDSFTLIDNSGNKMKVIGKQKGRKKLTVTDQKAYDAMRSNSANFENKRLDNEYIEEYNKEAQERLAEHKRKGGK